jgi:hypothetical protein
MQLTDFQRRVLERQLLLRKDPPTFGSLLRLNAPQLLKFVLALSLSAAFMWWLGAQLFAAGLVGFMVAGLVLAVLNLYRAVGSWGITERITNWPAVERLLGREPQA